MHIQSCTLASIDVDTRLLMEGGKEGLHPLGITIDTIKRMNYAYRCRLHKCIN